MIDMYDEPQPKLVPPPRSQTWNMNGYTATEDQYNSGYETAGGRRNMTPVQGDPYHDVFGGGSDEVSQYDAVYDYAQPAYDVYDKKRFNDSNGSTGSSTPPPSKTVVEDNGARTNLGNTSFLMAVLSEFWLFNIFFILGGTFMMTFYVPQFYVDNELWNVTCYWKLTWIFPLPYTLICFIGLALPFRTPKFIYSDSLPRRRCDNLYILTVTKGDNKEVFLK